MSLYTGVKTVWFFAHLQCISY